MRISSLLGLMIATITLGASAQTATTGQPATASPAAEAEALKTELELLKQRLNALEVQNAAAAKSAAEAQAAAAAAQASADSAAQEVEAAFTPPVYVEPWLIAENWQKILRGSDESVVKGLLGIPETTVLNAGGNIWVYQRREQPELGRGTVRFMKGRGAVNWDAPKFQAP